MRTEQKGGKIMSKMGGQIYPEALTGNTSRGIQWETKLNHVTNL